MVVIAEAPGLDAEQVETRILVPLERALADAPGVRATRGVASAGRAVVRCELDDDDAVLEARRAIASRLASAELPPGISAYLAAGGVGRDRVAYALRGDERSLEELRDLADWVVRPRLLAVPGVTEVRSCGGSLREVVVRVDPARLARYGLGIADLGAALSAPAKGAPGPGASPLELLGNEQVGAAVDGVPIRVRDVADILYAPGPVDCLAARPGTATAVVGLVSLSSADPGAMRAALDGVVRDLPRDVVLERLWDRTPVRFRLAVVPGATDEDRTRLAAALADELGRRAPGAAALVVSADQEAGGLPGEFDVLITQPPGDAALLALVSATTETVLGLDAPRDGTERLLVVFGPEQATLDRLASELAARLAREPVVEASGQLAPGDTTSLRFTPDAALLARHGISAGEVNDLVTALTIGLVAGEIIDRNRRYVVRIRVDASGADAMGRVLLRGTGGALVPLGQVATITVESVRAVVLHRDGVRAVEVWARGASGAALDAALRRAITLDVPPGYAVTITD